MQINWLVSIWWGTVVVNVLTLMSLFRDIRATACKFLKPGNFWNVVKLYRLDPESKKVEWDALRKLLPFAQFKKLEKHGEVLFLVKLLAEPAILLKVRLNVSFSRFLTCTNGTKSRKTLIFPGDATLCKLTLRNFVRDRRPNSFLKLRAFKWIS